MTVNKAMRVGQVASTTASGDSVTTGTEHARSTWRRTDTLAILLLLVAAAFFRLWRISDLPPGLSYDEADWGHMALQILSGQWIQIHELGSLHAYLAAPFIAWLGRVPLALRLPEALAGVATVLLLYLFVREAFERRPAAFLAAGLYAINFEASHLSRLAFPPNPLPLVQVACYYFLWRGWRRNQPWSLAAAGGLLALSLYVYQASLFLVAGTAVAWAVWLLTKRRAGLTATGMFWGAFILVALPFVVRVVPGFAYLSDRRYSHQFIFSPEVSGGAPLALLADQLWRHAGLFAFTGDGVWRHNLPGRPLFTPGIALLFGGGVLYALWNSRRPPYAFILGQLAFMFMPGVLARTDSGPLILHLAGILVLVCIFPALFLDRAAVVLGQRQRALGAGVLVLGMLLLAYDGYRTYVDYFQVWANQVGPTMSFDEVFVDTAAILEQDAGAVDAWILPKAGSQPDDLRASSFAFVYTGKTPVYWVAANDERAPAALQAALAGKTRAGLVTWDWDALKWAAPVYYDSKGLLRFLLGRAGEPVGSRAAAGVLLTEYALDPGASFALPSASSGAADARFGDQLALTAYDYGVDAAEAVPSGASFWPALRWTAIQPLTRAYKAALFLRDARGHLLAQSDQPITDATGATTASWAAGQAGWDVRPLSIPAGSPPGRHHLEVAVYDAETGARLAAQGETRSAASLIRLPEFAVGKAARTVMVEPAVPLSVTLGTPPTLRLLSHDPLPDQARPGDDVVLALDWQALGPVGEGVTLRWRLTPVSEGATGQVAEYALGGDYPASLWTAGEMVVERYDLTLGRELNGEYAVQLDIEAPGRFTHQQQLGVINVLGWPRVKDMPHVQRELSVHFGESLRLAGYSIGSVRRGEDIATTMCWQALAEMPRSYVTFVHLLDEQGRLVSQVDSMPGGGAQPTTAWLKGEYVCDEKRLALPADAPTGSYTLKAGVYDSLFQERLAAIDANGDALGDSVAIGTFQVGP